MKRILIIAYYFPPYGQVGAFRISKLVKYFNRFGWNVSVITIDEKYYGTETLDFKKLDDIPNDVKIIKTSRMDIKLGVREEGIYWGGSVFKAIYKECKKEKYDYIYYTSGPFMHLWVAPILNKISKVPYILDFRDPWLLSPYNNSNKFKKFAKVIEPRVIKSAKYILNVTDDATNMYSKHYKNVNRKKFITIENGFDSEDFENIQKKHFKYKGINVVYAGKLGEFRDITKFLDAVKLYNEDNDNKIIFNHIGKREDSIEKYIANNAEMEQFINQIGFLPYSDTLMYINSADVCLIISGGHPYEPTTKIYDYLALNKKILCINDIAYGYLYNTLKKNDNTTMVQNKTNEIIEGLKDTISKEIVIKENTNFDRKTIFRKLSNILEERGKNEI